MNVTAAKKSHAQWLMPDDTPPKFSTATKVPEPFRAVAERYLAGFYTYAEAGQALTLLGEAGCGKSLTAALIVRAVRRILLDTAFVQCGPEFLRLEGRRFDEATDRRLAWLGECPFVVFDDFTKLRPMSWGADMFDALVEKRYGNQLPSLFTGNCVIAPDDFSALDEQFGVGFTRRLQEGSRGLIVVAT